MKRRPQVVLAVTAGYMLGRTRKMRWALMLATAGAAGRLGSTPLDLVKHGVKVLGSSPELNTLADTVRGRLVEAGRTTAVSAASSQIDAFSDRLKARTEALGRAEKSEDEIEQKDEDQRTQVRDDQHDEQDDEPREERISRKQPQRRAAPNSTRRQTSGRSGKREQEEPESEQSEKPQRRVARSSNSADRSPVRRTRR